MTVTAPKTITNPNRLGGASLDGLRFGAALFILLFHFGDNAPTRLWDMFPLFHQGWLATDFFLMLSGFILMRAYGRGFAEGRTRPIGFMMKRIVRLWPSHIVILLALALVFLGTQTLGIELNHPDRYRWDKFWASVFMVQGWGFFEHPGWNVPTWSISALLVAYAFFGFLAKTLYRLKATQALAIYGGLLFSGLVISYWIFDQSLVDLPFRYGLFRVLVLFFMGASFERFVAISAVHIEIAPPIFWGLSLTALASITLIGFLPRHLITDISVLLFWSLILYAASTVRLKETAFSRRLGRVSYAQFVTQSFVGAVYYGLLNKGVKIMAIGEGLHWALWAFGLVLAVAFAFIFEALIDYPLSQKTKSLFKSA